MVMHAPVPADETDRLAALQSYEILDTPPDERFDLFTRLGTWLFHVPVCAINMVDEERTFFKSVVGFDRYEPRRATSICAHAVALGDPVMEVADLSRDPRFHDHPLFVKRGIRFYAGALIHAESGYAVGTFCIGDTRPRVLSEEERFRLAALAGGVGAVLELHRCGIRLLDAAMRDSLTGLFNRRHFELELNRVMARTGPDSRCALMYIDLDHFKTVNDTMGHAAGDALLVEVARRLTASSRREDLVARLGGDEFVVLMSDPVDTQAATQRAGRLLAAFAAPFIQQGRDVPIRASIGIALCPDHGTTASDLLRCADEALYAAKSDGRHRFRLHGHDQAEHAPRKIA